MAKRIKVRFNLKRGINYLKWKVEYPNKNIEYYSPCDVQLVLKKCELKNYKKTAEKIFTGAEKSVCAWVLCEEIEIRKTNFEQCDINCDKLKYNPRVEPNWVYRGVNGDGMKFNLISSVDYGLYVIN